ncbi:MAG: FKBP-type peptidyl-prolyl cis-trans isomerase [Deltaproteobacteria bacterium]|nr:FKBP-type peptidyl-prolyl cis-trans isomerase [Deltaproteobacteria bacterium]
MKRVLILLVFSAFLALSCDKTQQEPGAKQQITKEDLKTEDDRVSYSIGFSMGSSFKKDELKVNLDMFQQGVKDSFTGSQQILSEEEIQKTMMAFQQKMRAKKQEEYAKRMEERKTQGEVNKEKGKEFLETNKTKEDIVTLESGLQYKILEKGTGGSPKATDTVKCHYKGTTIDGKEFDSSYQRGEPATFALNRVIKGWTEGLQLMKEGGKWQFFVPSELAYGEKGAGQNIGPDEVLVFEVELIAIENPEAEKPETRKPEAEKPKKGS